MPKYKIMGERTLVEAWTYIVTADSEDEAIEMVEECPDGYCDGIERLDDDQCYQDDTEFSLLEEIIEKPKAKKAAPKKKMEHDVKTDKVVKIDKSDKVVKTVKTDKAVKLVKSDIFISE